MTGPGDGEALHKKEEEDYAILRLLEESLTNPFARVMLINHGFIRPDEAGPGFSASPDGIARIEEDTFEAMLREMDGPTYHLPFEEPDKD